MSSADRPQNESFDAADISVGIVVAEWNKEITETLLTGCLDTLRSYQIDITEDEVTWVPGSFELPAGARLLASSKKYDAIICLGCVIKGETDHDQYINQAVANGLIQLSMLSNIPCIFGVLTTLTKEQALERSGGQHGHKGVESAHTAVRMAQLKRKSSTPSKSIGFN